MAIFEAYSFLSIGSYTNALPHGVTVQRKHWFNPAAFVALVTACQIPNEGYPQACTVDKNGTVSLPHLICG